MMSESAGDAMERRTAIEWTLEFNVTRGRQEPRVLVLLGSMSRGND